MAHPTSCEMWLDDAAAAPGVDESTQSTARCSPHGCTAPPPGTRRL